MKHFKFSKEKALISVIFSLKSPNPNETFTAEIISDILSRLPVKPLLRFRCVSKPWLSLIDSKEFMKLHLNRTMETDSHRFLLVEDTFSDLFAMDFDSFERMDFGETPFMRHSATRNSCNGIVLVVSDKPLLWNPSTRKHKSLPPTSLDFSAEFDVYLIELYGFGYDSKNDDYKVVKVTEVSDGRDCEYMFSETRIYSSKSNSWKRVGDFPHMLPRWERVWGVCVNDALHTVVKRCDHSKSIMAFGLGTAEHYEVPKPDLAGENMGISSVEEMGGYLTALVPRKMNRTEIWVMKEYNVKESWTKLLCFLPPVPEPYMSLTPLAYSRKGDEVFLNYDSRCLRAYNLKKKASTTINVPGLVPRFYDIACFSNSFYLEVCVGSLVSLDSTYEAEEKEKLNMQGRKKGKKIVKNRDEFLSFGFKLTL